MEHIQIRLNKTKPSEFHKENLELKEKMNNQNITVLFEIIIIIIFYFFVFYFVS